MPDKLGMNYTAVILARNERERLPLVLKNFECLVNVLVVDNYSTDETREIAESYKRRWIQVQNEGGFCETEEWMQQVWPHLTTPYMLLAACAESLPISLLAAYDSIAINGQYAVVLANRISITAGLPIPIDYPPAWLSWKYQGEIRFFRKGAVCYLGNQVHNRGRITVKDCYVLKLGRDPDFCFYQYRDYDASETEAKHNVYNNTLALQLYKKGEKPDFIKWVFRALRKFLVTYFLYGGFRFGILGFMHCYYRFHMELGIYFRIYEYHRGLTKREIIALHCRTRSDLL